MTGVTDKGYTDGWTDRQTSDGVRSESVESQTCDDGGERWVAGWTPPAEH